jgi:hypothetical protein
MVKKRVEKKDSGIETIEGLPSKKTVQYTDSPSNHIFKYVQKPADYLCCKSINVYDFKWRVNIYSKRLVSGIEGQYISSSYFVEFDPFDNNITFVSPKI